MKTLVVLAVMSIGSFSVFGQDQKKTDSIVAEGKKLYRSEMASWYGTDILVEKFKDQRNNLGGYFSYANNDRTNCVFISKGDTPQVMVTVTFDSTYAVATAQADGNTRELTAFEKDMYLMRKAALQIINNDTMFKSYQNTSLNIIPVIDGDQRKVYVLTGPQNTGVVIIGNDYLLTFDKNNNLLAKKQLHRNILPFKFGQEANEFGGMHTHVGETGDYITATDICTLMLYSKFANWKSHFVMSEKYVSIWNCESNSLIVLTRDAWERIYDDQKKRRNN